MATVLVTGVGGACGIGAVRWLTAETSHRVIGVDMDSRAAGLYLADAGRTVPSAREDGWADALASVVASRDVDVVIPTVDEELRAIRSLYDALPSAVPVVAPRPAVVDTCLDKYRTHQRLVPDHQVPRTWLVEDRDRIDSDAFPLIVKPRRGRGSRGVTRVQNRDALEAHLETTDSYGRSVLLQEFVDGTEFTTSVVATREDRLLGVVPKEVEEKRGSTVRGVTRRAAAVASACRSICETLAPAGPLNVQQILDEDGVPHVIEINPRFSSTSCLTAAAGVDEFDLLIRDAFGESVAPPEEFQTDLYIQRYQDHVFVPGEEFERPPS